MLNEALIELSLDRLDSFRPESRRQVEYITDQLLYKPREQQDIDMLSERLKQINREIGA